MHQLYGLISYPHRSSFAERSFQNSIAACSVPYNAFFCMTCTTGLPFLSCSRYYSYNFGSTLASSVASGPSSLTCITSSTSVCMKALGISVVTTVLLSFASIVHVRNNDLIATAGALVSSFVLYSRCLRPSAHPLPLILPQRLFYRNIR
jgi:hypothetical protein